MNNLTTLFLGFLALGADAGQAQTAFPQYPSLDPKELGQVRNIIALAEQPGLENMTYGPRGAFDQPQFQLAWMYYALAVAQTQQIPAYRERFKLTSDQLIQKMMQPEVWNFWLTVVSDPKFAKYLDKKNDWRDPVREKNIMYSGHLLQMVGLYQRVYGDKKYTKSGSIGFKIDGIGGFNNKYSFRSLAYIIRQQFIDSQLHGIECEPNFIFAECNQHPILGLMDYDRIYGTKLADIRSGFWEKAEGLGFLNRQTSRFAGPHLKQQGVTGKMAVPWNDGWTGATLHAWNPEAVRRLYPVQRDAELGALMDQNPDAWRVRWSKSSVSTDFGFLAAYAAELSDGPTASMLLNYADVHFRPIFADGRYYYPRRDVSTEGAETQITGQESIGPFGSIQSAPLKPEQFGDHLVGPLTGNALLAFARLNPGGGLWNLYNNLEQTYQRSDPEVVNVAYPEVNVIQAYYDRAQKRLAVVLLPSTADAVTLHFGVRNLDRSKTFAVQVDGANVAKVDGGRVIIMDPAMKVEWGRKGTLTFEMAMGRGRKISIDQMDVHGEARQTDGFPANVR